MLQILPWPYPAYPTVRRKSVNILDLRFQLREGMLYEAADSGL